MRYLRLAVSVLVGACLTAQTFAADNNPEIKIASSDGSIRIGDVELRNEPGQMPYLSLAAAEKTLGKPEATYKSGNVETYAWHGIHLLKSLTRPADMVFKFQVWFDDHYDKDARKRTGKFTGYVQVDGVEIGPESTFEEIRGDLQKNGFAIGDRPGMKYASKRETSIFTIGPRSDKIQRIEVWVTQ